MTPGRKKLKLILGSTGPLWARGPGRLSGSPVPKAVSGTDTKILYITCLPLSLSVCCFVLYLDYCKQITNKKYLFNMLQSSYLFTHLQNTVPFTSDIKEQRCWPQPSMKEPSRYKHSATAENSGKQSRWKITGIEPRTLRR